MVREKELKNLRQTQSLHRSGHRIAIKRRINTFHNICRDVEEIPLIFDWDESFSGTIVHCQL